MLLIKQLIVPVDFHSISSPTMEVSGGLQLFLQNSSKYIILCST